MKRKGKKQELDPQGGSAGEERNLPSGELAELAEHARQRARRDHAMRAERFASFWMIAITAAVILLIWFIAASVMG